MYVRFFTGTKHAVENRNEAVKLIKDGLSEWMQTGDRIIWGYTHPNKETRKELPNIAWVINDLGEDTDASAYIGGVTNA